MKCILVSLFLFGSYSAFSQHIAHGVASSDVELMNFSGVDFGFRASFDKKNWNNYTLKNDDQIAVTIPKIRQYFFVELCQKSSSGVVTCDTIRLAPGKRYSLTLNDSKDGYIIRNPRDPS